MPPGTDSCERAQCLWVLAATLMVGGCGSAPQPSAAPAAAAAPAAERAPAALPAPEYGADFWKAWSDGQAEVAAYDLTAVRYGAPRQGTAVTIFVTEPFAESSRVKADPGRHPAQDEFPVMKLNLVKDYQTGVYDYNEMLSAFIALRPVGGRGAGTPAKLSFSAQEWCGHVYAQVLPAAGALSITSHSYWDGQADQVRSLAEEEGSFAEDALLPWARGQAAPRVGAGETKKVRLLASLFEARANPSKLRYREGELTRAAAPERVRVGGESRLALRSEMRVGGKAEVTVWTEAEAPFRVLSWETAAGERATLLRSERMKYWELNTPEGVKALRGLGLRRRGPATM